LTPIRRNTSPLDPSDRHSAVHPPVNAFGNHARTTADVSDLGDRLCVRPSDPINEKSGALSPTCNSTEEPRSPNITFMTAVTMAATVVHKVFNTETAILVKGFGGLGRRAQGIFREKTRTPIRRIRAAAGWPRP